MRNNLKEKLKLSTFILDTVPETVYMDKVYTQHVLIEFEAGLKAYVFDGAFEGHMLCTPDMIGKTKKIVLVMLVLSLGKMEAAGKDVDLPLGLQKNYAGPKLDLNGRIEEIIIPDDPDKAERWHDAIVDFGAGKILIDIDKEYFPLQLKAGDYVHVYGRVDLRGIE